MKTPKRHYELTTMEHSACERVWDRTQEEVSAQRWKRKNRVKQLKRTIVKLSKENEHLKQVLAVKVWEDVKAGMEEHVKYVAKHFESHITNPSIEYEMVNNNLIVRQKRPVFKWDGKLINIKTLESQGKELE